MNRYALIIDHESCWGCKACEVACKQENGAPDGIRLIRVSEEGPRMDRGRPEFVFRVDSCRHCDQPECVEACPEEAFTKREDGIVILDGERCIGCGLCLEACPYDAISLDPGESVALKCNLCHHRVDRGLMPACADNVCLAHCIYFGDPDSIGEQMRERRLLRGGERA